MTESKRTVRHLCQGCGNAQARFFHAGRWRTRSDHDLCPRCYRALMNRISAEGLGQTERCG